MTPEEISAMQAENAKLKTENEGFKKATPPKDPPKEDPKGDPKPTDDSDLLAKSKQKKDSEDELLAKTKQIESALSFNIKLKNFAEENKELLPSEFENILATAEKENYDSATKKANAIKSAVIQSFFSIQFNKEILTETQKKNLDDYLKLTKDSKEEKAGFIYENLFEPALETLKRVKKAEEVGKAKGGLGTSTKAEDVYKAKLIEGSKKQYLGEKSNA